MDTYVYYKQHLSVCVDAVQIVTERLLWYCAVLPHFFGQICKELGFHYCVWPRLAEKEKHQENNWPYFKFTNLFKNLVMPIFNVCLCLANSGLLFLCERLSCYLVVGCICKTCSAAAMTVIIRFMFYNVIAFQLCLVKAIQSSNDS